MPSIIEFTHPGCQLKMRNGSRVNDAYHYTNPSRTEGVRYWNNDAGHYRKFIQGNAILEGSRDYQDICFWGEWEAQSRFRLLNNTGSFLPSAIHFPILDMTQIGYHNTDPFAFGNRFYYSNCKQKSKRILRAIENFSVILFGTEYAAGFALDKVFVVQSSRSAREYFNNCAEYPEQFRLMAADHHDLYIENPTFRLYHGLMECDGDEMYSFVPCKRIQDCENGFPRPLLYFDRFNLQSPGARTVCTDITRGRDILKFWEELRQYLHDQGCQLATQIEMPPYETVEGLPMAKIGDNDTGPGTATQPNAGCSRVRQKRRRGC